MACQPVKIRIPGHEKWEDKGGLWCTTTETLFGQTFDTFNQAEDFCTWLGRLYGPRNQQVDPRQFSNSDLEEIEADWKEAGFPTEFDRNDDKHLFIALQVCHALDCGQLQIEFDPVPMVLKEDRSGFQKRD